MLSANYSGATRPIKAISVRDAGNVQRTISAARIRDADGVIRVIFGSVVGSVASATAVTVSPATARGFSNSSGSPSIDTGEVTASVAGGTPPYAYAWSRTDVPGDAWTINDPTSPNTTFTALSVASSSVADATFICTVTDAGGLTKVSPSVSATARNSYTVGGGGGPLP